MKYFYVLLVLLSFNLSASEDVVDFTTSILVSENLTDALSSYYEESKVEIFQTVLDENGTIDWFKCAKNHDSILFDTVACYVSYENLPSGLVWEFYYFLDEQKWVGTNLGIISVIPTAHCVRNIEFKKQLGQGINYEEVSCDKPRA
jgi:hypothetical protein|tara:strand:+ start:34 stop:471 length:438 start_codon:yes stop_codon:yes gene_type:complete